MLDSLPHFGFLSFVDLWVQLPYAWIVRPAVAGLLAAAFVLHRARGHRWLAVVALVGAAYPDLEKLAFFVWGWPHLLYPDHAHVASTYTAGLDPRALTLAQIALGGVAAVALEALSRRRRDVPKDAALDSAPEANY